MNDKDLLTLITKTIKKFKIVKSLKFIVEKVIKVINNNNYLIFKMNI